MKNEKKQNEMFSQNKILFMQRLYHKTRQRTGPLQLNTDTDFKSFSN